MWVGPEKSPLELSFYFLKVLSHQCHFFSVAILFRHNTLSSAGGSFGEDVLGRFQAEWHDVFATFGDNSLTLDIYSETGAWHQNAEQGNDE
jgi:hypothetical protein